MIKKLLLTLSFIALIAITFSGTTHKAQAADTITVAEELTKLNDLYKEGAITEAEYSKAKYILLNPDTEIGKKEKKKKEKLTAAERKQLKDAEQDELKALKEQLRAEKNAERERIKQDALDERTRIIEERKEACSADPKSKACKTAKKRVTNIYEKLKIMSQEVLEKGKEDRALDKQAIKERKERLQKERALEKQAKLEEQEKIKVEKALRKAERARLKAEWKKACSEDPESKACKEGKPSEKIKNVLKKIEKKLGG